MTSLIVSVDGKSVKGVSAQDVVSKLILGKEGTVVSLIFEAGSGSKQNLRGKRQNPHEDTDQKKMTEQAVARQPAISSWNPLQTLFNRAGGRTETFAEEPPSDETRPHFTIPVMAIHPGIGQVHLASARLHLICGDCFRLMRRFVAT